MCISSFISFEVMSTPTILCHPRALFNAALTFIFPSFSLFHATLLMTPIYLLMMFIFCNKYWATLFNYTLWQYGLWNFQTWDTKLERFLPKNQHIQRKLLSFGLMASRQNVPRFDFQNQFSTSKIIQIFLNSFSMKNTNLGANFLFLTFIDKINFYFVQPIQN